MMKRSVSIQGRGIVSTRGRGLSAQLSALRAGLAEPSSLSLNDLQEPRALLYYPVTGEGGAQRLSRLLEAAVSDALDEAALAGEDLRDCAIFVGSSSMDVGVSETVFAQALAQGDEALALPLSGYGNIAAQVARRFSITGLQLTFNTACSASANALLYGAKMIRAGRIRHALVLGVEDFNRVSAYGFDSLMLSSTQGLRPFDRARDGLVLGEGVGAVVLGAEVGGAGFSLRGGANRCDTASATNASAEQIAQVMAQALADADIAASDVQAIKAHGTGTPSNDLAEAQGMRVLFSDALPAFTSIKPVIGHTLGACGVLEAICFSACLENGFIPPTGNFSGIDEAMNAAPLTQAIDARGGDYLLNFFGFGGNNSSLVMRYAC